MDNCTMFTAPTGKPMKEEKKENLFKIKMRTTKDTII